MRDHHSTSRAARLLRVPVLLAGVWGACASPESVADARADGSGEAAVEKLDPAVRDRWRRGERQTVILLGSRQLLEPRTGFPAFVAEHAGDDRLALRAEVTRALRDIARAEQGAIVSALQLEPSRPVRRLWIVNAMAVVLDPRELADATRLPGVRFVYPTEEAIAVGTAIGEPPPTRVRAAAPATRRTDARVPWNVRLLGAARVWSELGVTGRGVVVAIYDSGLDVAHPDLRANLWSNPGETPGNGRDDDGNGYVDDVHGVDFASLSGEQPGVAAAAAHGTFVAGIVAGNGAGGIATGVAPEARLMSLRGPSPSAAALAFQYALDQGADVVNMSFSLANLGNLRGLWRMMSEHAVAAGLVLAGGAGNFQQTAAVPSQIVSPKDVPAVIVAGGVDSTDRLVPYSSVGPVEWQSVALYGDHPMPVGLAKPDLVAFPGPGYPLLRPGGGYLEPNASIQGNSFSGPHAAGVAALVLAANSALPAWRVKALLEATARDLPPAGRDVRTGAGRLDAWAAAAAAVAAARAAR